MNRLLKPKIIMFISMLFFMVWLIVVNQEWTGCNIGGLYLDYLDDNAPSHTLNDLMGISIW